MTDSKPVSVAETLRAARAKIVDPDHWTKGSYARPSKRSSEEVAADSPKAGAWCALGALSAVDGPFERDAVLALSIAIAEIEYVFADGPNTRVFRFNDAPERRHRDILRVFDKAIAAAEAVQS